MEDTSFAIHPEGRERLSGTKYSDIGQLLEFIEGNRQYQFRCVNGCVNIQFYREDIVRIVMNPHGKPIMKNTPAVILDAEEVKVTVRQSAENIELASAKLVLVIGRNPLRVKIMDHQGYVLVEEQEYGMGFSSSGEVTCYKKMAENAHFYGFGEKSGFLDKRGEKLTMWNTDVYAPHNPETDALYQSIPYFMELKDGKAFGLYFDNSYKTAFDLRSSKDRYSFSADGGELNYYVLAGQTPKKVLEQYTSLTGRMPIPPKWALGYHQSRYSYETEQEVKELAKNFLAKGLPLDAIYLDIHYMDGYRVFTFDKERFPNPEKLLSELRAVGINVVPIVDPGVKEDPEYAVFLEGIQQNHFCRYLDGRLFYGDVWPGNSAFPDFANAEVRQWWGEKHRFYTDLGVEGIWNDMNEPSVFNDEKTMDAKVIHRQNGELKTHRELHNLYGFLMGEATYSGMRELLAGKRPFLLTRAGFSGIQRYATVWTGDNRSFWEHLAMSLPMCMNLGLSGVAFTGPDVGGFAHDTNAELLVRWTQVGAFYPYFRNHSAIGTVRQEPWSFGEEYETIIKKYLQLRYQWLPQLYTLFAMASRSGLPVMRPLFMEYPEDKNTVNLADQFMLGDNVIVAPIIQPSATHRVVYLPEGEWFDYWTEDLYQGGKHLLFKAELDTLPLFVKAGTFLAQGLAKQSTKVRDELIDIHIYSAAKSDYRSTIYEDDGETFDYETGKYFMQEINVSCNESTIDIKTKTVSDTYTPTWEKINYVIHDNSSRTIIFNGKKVVPDILPKKFNEKVFSLKMVK